MVTEASNGIELSLVEPAYGKRETLPDPSSVTSKTRLSTVPCASSSRACGWVGGEKYDNVAGSHGLFAQKSGAGPVDLDRSSRFELTASRDQCPISTPRCYDLHRARLVRLLDFAVAGDFFLFLSLCLSALAFAAPLGRSAAETGAVVYDSKSAT